MRNDDHRSNQFEYIDDQNAHEKQQRDGAEQQMANIVFAIPVAMGQCMISDEAGYQQKYPVNHSYCLWCSGSSECRRKQPWVYQNAGKPSTNLSRPKHPDPVARL